MDLDYSEHGGGVLFAGLSPYAPVLIPAIGQQRLEAAAGSPAAMGHLAARLAARRPQGVVVISPHSPSRSGSYGVWSGSQLHGSFEEFGFPAFCVDARHLEIGRRPLSPGLVAVSLGDLRISPEPQL